MNLFSKKIDEYSITIKDNAIILKDENNKDSIVIPIKIFDEFLEWYELKHDPNGYLSYDY